MDGRNKSGQFDQDGVAQTGRQRDAAPQKLADPAEVPDQRRCGAQGVYKFARILADKVTALARMDHYERRALARRNRAIRPSMRR